MKTGLGAACEMEMSWFLHKRIPTAGSCLSPGLCFHFQNLCHPLVPADALQQPQQKPRMEEVRGGLARPHGLRSRSADRQGMALALSA